MHSMSRTHEVKTIKPYRLFTFGLLRFPVPVSFGYGSRICFNLSFEEQGSNPEKPRGWWVDSGATVDMSTAHTGKCSLRIHCDEKTNTGWKAEQALPIRLVAGRSVRLTGYVITDKVAAENVKVSISVFDRSLKETGRAESKGKRVSDPIGWSVLKTELCPSLDATSAYIEVELATGLARPGLILSKLKLTVFPTRLIAGLWSSSGRRK